MRKKRRESIAHIWNVCTQPRRECEELKFHTVFQSITTHDMRLQATYWSYPRTFELDIDSGHRDSQANLKLKVYGKYLVTAQYRIRTCAIADRAIVKSSIDFKNWRDSFLAEQFSNMIGGFWEWNRWRGGCGSNWCWWIRRKVKYLWPCSMPATNGRRGDKEIYSCTAWPRFYKDDACREAFDE